ncbi:MAG: DUF6496 domain-containing protein [Candidatus Binatia bacterium]
MAKYGKKAARKVKKVMHERKKGTLKSGRSGKKVTSRKQAIAIGLSEARREGAKVPRKKSKKKQSAIRCAKHFPQFPTQPFAVSSFSPLTTVPGAAVK